jgi:hypothetical protein
MLLFEFADCVHACQNSIDKRSCCVCVFSANHCVLHFVRVMMASKKGTRLTAVLLVACAFTAVISQDQANTRDLCQTGELSVRAHGWLPASCSLPYIRHLTAAGHHAGLWSSTNALLGISINHGVAINPLQPPMQRQACSLHACITSTGAAAQSCKLQHVAQLQLQQGALITEPKMLLQALQLDTNDHEKLLSNNTDPVADLAQKTSAAAAGTKQQRSTAAAAAANWQNSTSNINTKTTKPPALASTDSAAAVTLHMAACCEQQHSSSSACLTAPHPAAAPFGAKTAQGQTNMRLQDTLQQQQQQQQQGDEQPIWSNTVVVTLSEQHQQQQQAGEQKAAAAGCAPAAKHWDVATPVLPRSVVTNAPRPDAAHKAHVPAGTAAAAAAAAERASASVAEDNDLQDNSSSSQQLLLIELHLPAASSAELQASSNSSIESATAAAAMQQAAKGVTKAGDSLQLWLGRAAMLMVIVAVQVAVYRFATT